MSNIEKNVATMLNRIVLIIGRLTWDPVLRYTPSGAAVASFRLAVECNFKNSDGEREADFIDIVALLAEGMGANGHLWVEEKKISDDLGFFLWFPCTHSLPFCTSL